MQKLTKLIKNPFQNYSANELFIMALVFILTCIGTLVVFSSTFFINLGPSSYFNNQMLFYGVGFIFMIIIGLIDYQILNKKVSILMISTIDIALLILVLAIGVEVFGAKRWIDIGFFNLQPSEIAKVSVVLVSAFLLTHKFVFKKRYLFKKESWVIKFSKEVNNRLASLTLHKPYLISILLSLMFLTINTLLILLQKSLGNTLLVNLIFLSILLYSLKFDTRFFIKLGFICVSAVFGALIVNETISNHIIPLAIFLVITIFMTYKFRFFILHSLFFILFGLALPLIGTFTYDNILQRYQKQRVESFLQSSDELNQNAKWNELQAVTAVGSGLLQGKGFLKGTQSNEGYLPFAHTDFAFAMFAEQTGFLGIIFLLIIYNLLFISILMTANGIEDKFGKLICVGVLAMIFFNTIQHIGMNLGLLPITGVPLPFISYGGSSNLIFFIGMGLILSISKDQRFKKIKVIDLT